MNLLIATDPFGNAEALQASLVAAEIELDAVTYVESAKALIAALMAGSYDFILTEYTVAGLDIWRLSKLINSAHFSAHARPILMIKESSEIDIPVLLAKEYGFTVVSLEDLTAMLKFHDPVHGRLGECSYPARNTVIIIEDDKDSALSAYHALKETYDIDVAYDGLSGYALWQKKQHDLVLLDLMLPKLSGEQILNQMMAINKNQSEIIVTALDKPNVQNKVLLNGASEYLCKPFSLDDLKTLCQTLLNKSKLLHQAHYLDSRLNVVRNLIWLLDYSLRHNETVRVKEIMTTLKGILPNNLTDDEKISLLTTEV